jgi:acyl carrier protein
MQESTFSVVKDILVTNLGVDEELVTPDAHLLKDLELDSTDTVEISLQLKKQLGVELKLQIRDDPTVGQVCEQVDALRVEKPAGNVSAT